MRDHAFKKRLKMLREERQLTQVDAARLIGLSYKALQDHEGGRQPNKNNLKKYARIYGVNEGWLLTGLGEKRPGEEQRAGPGPLYIKGTVVPNNQEEPAPEPAFKISDDLMMVSRVLESGTSYAAALHLNIVHFDRAVTSESKIAKLEHDNSEIRKENATLNARIDRLEATVEKFIKGQRAAQEGRKTGTHA